MKFPRPIITKEHGSWAVLLIPMAVAAGTVGAFNVNALILVFASLGVFMSYVPVHSILREVLKRSPHWEQIRPAVIWGSLYSGIGALAAAPLFLQGYWFLLALGAVGSGFFFVNFVLTRQLQKSILTDLIGVAGLTLGAPAMYYVLTRWLDETAFVLYLLSFLFFGSSVCYVHMKIEITKTKKSDWTFSEKLTAGRLNLAYHIIVIAIVVALSFYRLTPAMAVLAFTPMTIHAIWGTYRLSSRVSFSRLGFALLAQSIVFSLLWIIIAHT